MYAISREEPQMDVLTRAPQLASLSAGSTVVLCLRPDDFDWLNGARPAVLGHRIVLFGDAGTVTALSQRAFDFFDWISHRIEAPAGPPAFVVRALASAMCARPRVIVWVGAGLDEAFAAVRPGQRLARLPATLPYPALVDGMRPGARSWVAVTAASDQLTLRRARWAAAEAGRAGKTLLIDPGEVPAGATVVSARTLPIDEAERMLSQAGVEHPARTAALLGLEAAVIEHVCLERAPASLSTATGADAPAPDLPGEPWHSRLGPWDQAVDEALAAGDQAVAARWIARWQQDAPEDPYARVAHALTEIWQGKLGRAEATLEEARRRAPQGDKLFRFFLLRAEVLLAAHRLDRTKCATLAGEALRLGMALHRSSMELASLHTQQIVALAELGRIAEAERSLHQARNLPQDARVAGRLAEAEALIARRSGDPERAVRLLSSIPHGAEGDSPVLAQILSRAWIDQRRFEDAERLTRAAITKAERRGDRADHLHAEHASALLELGRFDEAIVELRALLAGELPPANAAVARTELGRCLTSQGQFDEAAGVLDDAVSYFEATEDRDNAAFARALYARARVELTERRYPSAEKLLRRTLAVEEASLGKQHPTLIETLAALGEVLLHLERPREAELFAKRALKLAEATDRARGRAMALHLLAAAQMRLGYAHAGDTLRRAGEAEKALHSNEPLVRKPARTSTS